MSFITAVDAEDVVCAWVKTLSLPTSPQIFLHALGQPLPRIQMYQVTDIPNFVDASVARISFEIHAANRPQAKAIKKALKGEILSLAYADPVRTPEGTIEAAEIASDVWRPNNSISCYILDARFVIQPL